MSWQDELQQLDSALASGQISADEYRTRRDRVIAQASGQQQSPEQPPQQSAEPTTVFRAVQPEPQQPQQDAPDRTQIVSGAQTGDRTQVVSGRNDADSTQIVSGRQAAHPHFPPPQPPPPWETAHPQQPNLSPPPWANEDLPPEFGQQSWPRQGPEVFDEKSSGNAGKVIGIIAAVVLVLALAGGAIWFFALKDNGKDPQAGGDSSQEQTTEKTSKKPPPPDIPQGPFLDLPGDKVLNRTVPIQQAVAEKLPTETEAPLLQTVGVSSVGGLVTDDDGLRRGIWAFKIGDGVDATAVLTAMDQLYQQAQYTLVSDDKGILVRKLAAATPDKPTVFRAHYLTDDGYMVRVEVYGNDSANVESTFNDLIEEETDKFAPAE